MIPSGAKALVNFGRVAARLNSLRKKAKKMPKPQTNLPSRAKALVILLALSARLKPCPFKTVPRLSFSAACEAVPLESNSAREFFRSL
jgi:hypothetical protein